VNGKVKRLGQSGRERCDGRRHDFDGNRLSMLRLVSMVWSGSTALLSVNVDAI